MHMIEKKLSDYREFRDSTPAELGYGPDVVNSKVIDYKSHSGQHIGVFVTEPYGGFGGTIIMPQSHDYRNEPLVMKRAEIIASHTGNRVALVETPGTVGLVYPDNNIQGYEIYDSIEPIEGGRQTFNQLKRASMGDFTEHASLQLDAVEDVLHLTDSDRLTLFGESMGAVTSTEMIRHIGRRGLRLDTVILHEVVNPSRDRGLLWLRALLSSLTTIENDRRDQYFLENEFIGHPIRAFEQTSEEQSKLDKARKNLYQQGLGSLANGLGMRIGIGPKLIDSLKKFDNVTPEILLSRGVNSQVAEKKEYEQLQDSLRQHSFPVSAWEWEDFTGEQEIGHSFAVSLGRQAIFARELIQRIS